MTNVKVFVHATDTDVDTRAMTLAPRTCVPARLKESSLFNKELSNSNRESRNWNRELSNLFIYFSLSLNELLSSQIQIERSLIELVS